MLLHGTALQVQLVPSFSDLLSREAKLIYDRKIDSTIDEYLYCCNCKIDVSVLPTPLLVPYKKIYEGHDKHKVVRKVRFVNFMSLPFSVSLPCMLIRSTIIEDTVEQKVAEVAKAFNLLVAKKLIPEKGKVLLQCSVVALPTDDLTCKYTVALFVTTSTPNIGKLNKVLKMNNLPPMFKHEGKI